MEIAVTSHDNYRRSLLIRLESRVHEMRETLKQWEIRERRDQATCQNNLLPTNTIGQRTENKKERGSEYQGQTDKYIRRDKVELEVDQEKKERVELAGVPDNALARRRSEERNRHVLVVRISKETVDQRLFGTFAL